MIKSAFIRTLVILVATSATACANHKMVWNCKSIIDNQKSFLKHFDVNNDNALSRHEWNEFKNDVKKQTEEINKKYNSTSNDSDIENMFDEIDTDKNGFLSLSELTRGACPNDLKGAIT